VEVWKEKVEVWREIFRQADLVAGSGETRSRRKYFYEQNTKMQIINKEANLG
jgi:hypothetical protein